MTTLTAARAATLPSVNLLPPEIAEAAKFRRLQTYLGMFVVLTVLAIGALWFLAHSQAQAAQSDLEQAQAQTTALQAQVAQYAHVPEVYSEVTTAQTQLVTAMTPEVRWSFYLNDLSLTIPDGVRLVSLQAVEPYAASASTGVATTTSPSGVTGIGTISYVGKANNYDAVAKWLQVQNRQPGLVDPYPQSISDPTDQSTAKRIADFNSSVTVTADALSHRYDKWGK